MIDEVVRQEAEEAANAAQADEDNFSCWLNGKRVELTADCDIIADGHRVEYVEPNRDGPIKIVPKTKK